MIHTLLPCTICGGQATFEYDSDLDYMDLGWAYCTACGAGIFGYYQDTVEMWNRRAREQGDSMISFKFMTDRLARTRRETMQLEDEISRFRDETTEDITPGLEDVGRWVKVRDSDDDTWRGPFPLTKVVLTATPYYQAIDLLWKQARIVPGVGRVTLQKHNGSNTKPEWLADNDKVIVEYQWGETILKACNVNWKSTFRYQKVETK